MKEAEFWYELRLRINLAPDNHLGWCDWLEPRKYRCAGPSPRIIGRAGYLEGGRGRGSPEEKFELLLPKPVRSPDEIEWHTLLPPHRSINWFRGGNIVPSAAIPDGQTTFADAQAAFNRETEIVARLEAERATAYAELSDTVRTLMQSGVEFTDPRIQKAYESLSRLDVQIKTQQETAERAGRWKNALFVPDAL